MLTEHQSHESQETHLEQRIAELEQQLQTTQRQTKRIGYLIAAILAAVVLHAWLQTVRMNRLYDAIITRDIATARPPLAAPAWHRQLP